MREDVFSEGVFRFRAIEEDVIDVWMGVKKRLKVVRNDGVFEDIRIEAALAFTRVHDVPERDSAGFQNFDSVRVRYPGIGPQQFADDSPKGVLRIRVVFVSRK